MAAPDIGWMGCTAHFAAEHSKSGTRRRYWNLLPFAAIGIIVLLALALRLRGISLESLDGDEIFSYRVVSSHFSAAIAIIRNDLVHPPLYYFLLRAWLHIAGHVSPVVLRGLSLVFGIATVALVSFMGWMFPQVRAAAFIAACLLAANDLHIFYSQQVRSYSFYAFLFACLLTWSWQIYQCVDRIAFWCVGGVVMSLLVYTHYVGALYIACIIAAVTLSPMGKRVKLRIWLTAFISACSFVPWILAELGPARQHHGTQDNLIFESRPTLYDLKAIWASYLGIPPLHGATTAVLLIGLALIGFTLFYRCREQNPFRQLFLMTLVLTAVVPPCVLFVLSLNPFSLHLFGARHLLPSIVSYLLLAADGLVQLGNNFRVRTAVLIPGVTLLLVFELVPTVTATTAGPRRMPFQAIVSATQGSMPLYTTWPYGIGETMNFYEHNARSVQSVPKDASSLPSRFQLIFRPELPAEEQAFEHLLRIGWKNEGARDFYNGLHTGYHVRVAHLQLLRLN